MGIKGLMEEGWDFIKTKSSDAAEEVKKYAQGLRGQAQPSAAAPTPPPAPSTPGVPVPYDPVEGQRFGPPDAPRSPLRQPYVGPGRYERGLAANSPEAQAYQAARNAQPQAAAPAPSNKLGKLGVAGIVAGEAVQTGPTLFDPETSGTEKVREGARSLIRGGATVLGGAGGAALGSLVPGPGTVVGGIAGGAGGYAAGDYLAEQVLGPKRVRNAPVIPAAQATPVGTMPPAIPEQPAGDNLIDTTRGLRVTPEQMMSGTQVPVEGQGAFKRTTRGNVGAAQKVGARSDTMNIGKNPAALPEAKGLAGHMVNMSILGLRAQAASALEHGKAKEASLGIKAATANAGIAKIKHDIDKDADAKLDKTIENEVLRKAPTQGFVEKDGEYKSRIAQQKGELSARIAHSAANRKIPTADLNDQQVRQLAMANNIRNAIDKDRTRIAAGFRDYFGNKRFDSDDLYNYMPEVKDGKLHFGGNSAPIEAVIGGQFNPFSPNEPVQRDFMELVQAAIARSKKGK